MESEGLDEIRALLAKAGRSLEWLLDAIRREDPEFPTHLGVTRVTVKNIGEKKGFCSRCFRLTFHFDADESTSAPSEYSVVLKLPTDEFVVAEFQQLDFSQEALASLTRVVFRHHNIECRAYSLLRGLQSTGFPIPRVFVAEQHDGEQRGLILMEDMSKAGAATLPIHQSLTAEQCVDFARWIADFQAFVHSLPADSWRDRFRACLFIHEDDAESEDMKKQLKLVYDFRPHDQNGVIQRFLDLNLRKHAEYALRKRPEELGVSMLCHGDTWANNVMLRRNADGSVGSGIAALLDWALLFEGNPLFDIARFVVCGADAEVRRACVPRVLDAFHSRLAERLGRPPPFTREQADELFELAAVHQTAALLEFFKWIALPQFAATADGVERAKGEKLWLRVRFALEDAAQLMDKHAIDERFRLDRADG
ncbi:DUF1679 domain containing protein [Aphelenchoides fujianensis]|nr:DUF1679 domain containing protein [Aphelenchoides fujianensis]